MHFNSFNSDNEVNFFDLEFVTQSDRIVDKFSHSCKCEDLTLFILELFPEVVEQPLAILLNDITVLEAKRVVLSR